MGRAMGRMVDFNLYIINFVLMHFIHDYIYIYIYIHIRML